MDRRSFLRGLALSAGGVYVSTKTFFLPPAGGWFVSDGWELYPSQQQYFGPSIMELLSVQNAQRETTMRWRYFVDQLANR